jgi:hypothetical protein
MAAAMTNPIPSFKFLEDCVPRDLVRINLGDRTEWALVGTKNERLLLVCILSGNDAPYLFDAAGYMGPVKPEHDNPVLWYGRAYSLLPDHAGACNVNSGPLFGVHGTMFHSEVDSGSSLFLCCRFPERGDKKAYYNIETGNFSGEPGGMRASFGRWALRLDKTITETEEPMVVAQFPLSVSAAPISSHEKP